MTRYFIATFSAGTRQFLMTEDDDPPPYPAFVETDEATFMEQRRQRNRERKADKKRIRQGPGNDKSPATPMRGSGAMVRFSSAGATGYASQRGGSSAAGLGRHET